MYNEQTKTNNIILTYPTSENLNDSNKININDTKKTMVLPIDEINEKKIVLEIKIKQKRFCGRLKRRLSRCFCENLKQKIILIVTFSLMFIVFLVTVIFLLSR